MLPPRVRQETGQQFVKRVMKELREKDGVAFAIVLPGSSEVVGQIRLMNWSRVDGRAEVGYWLRRKYWGRGYGSEALQSICEFGFRSLRLHRIYASVVDGNKGSMKVLERAGFHLEGRRRHDTRLARRWADILEYGLLRKEWQ